MPVGSPGPDLGNLQIYYCDPSIGMLGEGSQTTREPFFLVSDGEFVFKAIGEANQGKSRTRQKQLKSGFTPRYDNLKPLVPKSALLTERWQKRIARGKSDIMRKTVQMPQRKWRIQRFQGKEDPRKMFNMLSVQG